MATSAACIFHNPLVSIVIPCFNGVNFVSEAIASALNQTHQSVEVIFVDDGSSDGSTEVARTFRGIRILSQQNSGVSVARNAGLEASKGDFVLFLDADDRLDPDAVRYHLEGFRRSQLIPMVFGSNRIVDADGKVIGHNTQAARSFDWRDVLMGVTPTPSQSMFRRDAVLASGGFNHSVKLGEDFDFYLRTTKRDAGYCHGALVADYRQHAQQATKQPSASLISMLGVITEFRATTGSTSGNGRIWSTAQRHWKIYYGQYIPLEILKSILKRDWTRALKAAICYVRYIPDTLFGTLTYLGHRIGSMLER